MESNSKKSKKFEDVYPEECEILKRELPKVYEVMKDAPFIEPEPEFVKSLHEICIKKLNRIKNLELAQRNEVKSSKTIISFFSNFGFYSKLAFAGCCLLLLLSGFLFFHFITKQPLNLIAINIPTVKETPREVIIKPGETRSIEIKNEEQFKAVDLGNIKTIAITYKDKTKIIKKWHVEIVESLKSTSLTVVEENASPDPDAMLIISIKNGNLKETLFDINGKILWSMETNMDSVKKNRKATAVLLVQDLINKIREAKN